MQVLEDSFRACCADGRALRSEEEYIHFKAAAQQSGIVQELHEIIWLDEIWQDASRAAAWHHQCDEAGSPELSFETFQKRIREQFGGILPGAIEHTNGLEAMDAEISAFTEQVAAWDVPSLSEKETKQLIGVFQGLEAAFTEQTARTQQLLSKQQMLMAAEQSRRLVHQRLALEQVEHPAGTNPYIWQRANKSVIEQQISRRRVRNIREVGGSGQAPADSFGLGAGFSCRRFQGTRGTGARGKSGGNGLVDIDIFAVLVPKRASTMAMSKAMEQAWKVYDAHRELSLSAYIPHTLGIHDKSTNKKSGSEGLDVVELYYEYTPSRSIAKSFIGLSGGTVAESFQFGEQHALFQHWSREVMKALHDLQRMSAYELRGRLSWENFFVSNQGTSLRLGNMPWGARINGNGKPIASAVAERNTLLLASFADIIDDLVLCTTPSSANPLPLPSYDQSFDAVAKAYSEHDAAGGVYVRPGEHFAVVLPKQAGGSRWHFPDIQIVGKHGNAVPVEVAGIVDTDAAVPEDASGGEYTVTFAGVHVGRVVLHFYCHPVNSERPGKPALVVPVLVSVAAPSPPLAAILRCCRGAGGISLSIDALASHETFQAADVPIDAVMAEYTAMVEAQRKVRTSRHEQLEDYD